MSALVAANLAFAWPQQAPLFEDVHLHLTSGWTGLVGANGAGKSTLLRLLAGELDPTRGTVRGPTPTLCPQRVDACGEAIASFAWSWDRDSVRWRARLGLEVDDLERWATLSPGERKRWQVAAALAAEPPVLLLDEPTNHLDVEARGALLGALERYRGVGVIVSHDRAFLDALCAHTVEVGPAGVRQVAGGWSAAQEVWSSDRAREEARRDAAQQEVRSLKRRLSDARRARGDAERGRSLRKVDPRDHDGRSTAAKARAANGEAQAARQVTLARARMERAQAELPAMEVHRELGRSVFVDFVSPRRRRLLSVSGQRLVAGDRELVGRVELAVDRDTRVRLAGPNGAGKTTLLRALLAGAHLEPERILYVPQELSVEHGLALVRELETRPPAARGRVMQLVAALGVDPGRLLDTRIPSPGEARKLAIADGLARHVACVVLDEPTNHLDLPSIARLQEALKAYPGALVLVTHDQALADAVTDQTWTLRDGAVLSAHGAVSRAGA